MLVPPAPDGPADPSPRQLNPRICSVWRARAMVWVLCINAALVAIGILSPADSTARLIFVALGLAGFVGGTAAAIVLPKAFWSRWSYAVLADALDLKHGLMTHRRSTVPYYRVQHIDLRSGPVERSLGLTRLVIRTASATSDSELPGLATADAEELRRLVLARAGQDDAV